MLPSLCKIAWEWFLALGSSCFSSVGKMLCTAWKKTSAYCVGRKPLKHWQSVGRVGHKKDSDSVPIFLISFGFLFNY
ncbi:hypothetical protein BWK59_03215 [Flavobacterium davisii]|uniref:Uncharacterized protein n=1 Tax=Flavobacterium davisii TaxID=2906077 RepID=A0A246GKK9_9FLAO|nr:hypothetical protein BWK59_03215 [Flavobacterium davisii]